MVELEAPIYSIGMVLAFAAGGQLLRPVTTLALLLWPVPAPLFPFFSSPFLGWLGVFLTGSDTSSNALFCSLRATAHQVGVSDTLQWRPTPPAASPADDLAAVIAVACAAIGLVGRSRTCSRFTVKHSLYFATMVEHHHHPTGLCLHLDDLIIRPFSSAWGDASLGASTAARSNRRSTPPGRQSTDNAKC